MSRETEWYGLSQADNRDSEIDRLRQENQRLVSEVEKWKAENGNLWHDRKQLHDWMIKECGPCDLRSLVGYSERVIEHRTVPLHESIKKLEYQVEVMRELLESGQTITFEGCQCQAINCEDVERALSTSAGKSLLDKLSGYEKRLVEAEKLLGESEPDPSKIVDDVEWRTRRDAFLNPNNKDVM